ncbi:hypothetical protein Nepgr_000071 [Nepenthes gracilis]|uniref:Uncharacterized protein n=1 Tax=Nepenthes gracilis TaxID=150966 RepID=A0AAD3RVA1_NEPGR|nr:hypothetical protein Nepgr_000071 [Nepenthes gracilis]
MSLNQISRVKSFLRKVFFSSVNQRKQNHCSWLKDRTLWCAYQSSYRAHQAWAIKWVRHCCPGALRTPPLPYWVAIESHLVGPYPV